MKESQILYSFPEPCIQVLKLLFSLTKASVGLLATKYGTTEGNILNILHDLKIIGLVKKKEKDYVINLQKEKEVKDITYGKNEKQILKNIFLSLEGVVAAIKELKEMNEIDIVNIGKTFAYHKGAKAVKETSWKQIGRVYFAWLKYLGIIEEIGDTIKIKEDI